MADELVLALTALTGCNAAEIAHAVEFLEIELGECLDELRERIAERPADWIMGRLGERPLHFTWGMSVRNALRDGGFGEDYFGMNLDDVYVPLCVLAAERGQVDAPV